MPESSRIAEQLRRALEGDAWHGPALLELLTDVDARIASSHPVAGAHSIWELILHVMAWDRVILRRMAGEALMPSDEENFPTVKNVADAAWSETISQLRQSNRKMLEAIALMSDSRLTEQVPGKDYDFYFMLHGAVQHALYHAGQIAILKKAAQHQ